MKALPYVGVALAIGLAVGWGVGIYASSRINTIAVRAYIDSRDLQVQSEHEKEVSEKLLACRTDMTARLSEIAADRAALAKEQWEHQADLRAEELQRTQIGEGWAARLKVIDRDYSETIIGLREQLHAAGIAERIVRATR